MQAAFERPSRMHAPAHAIDTHNRTEDVLALLTGAAFISLGLVMFREARLLSGGTAGVAFLAHYASGWRFGLWFFVINLPFYVLAWRRMGAAFTLKTLAAVTAISAFTEVLPQWVGFAHLAPLYAAVMGGSLIGCGLLILFRHNASLGGLGILALVAQDSGWMSAGRFQMMVDAGIVLAALAVADVDRVMLSVAGAVALNLVLLFNHRPGRYLAMS